MISKPQQGEYAPFQEKYINLIEGDVLQVLLDQKDSFSKLIETLSENKLDYRYEEGKWTLRQLITHIIDTENIFNYRALCISRGEKQTLPGFDHNAYVESSVMDNFSGEYLVNYFNITRYATLILYKGMTDTQWDWVGNMDNYSMTLRSFPFMTAGHLEHHLNIIKNRYL
jgi:hypothetical protein